jgi:hypothetical protein
MVTSMTTMKKVVFFAAIGLCIWPVWLVFGRPAYETIMNTRRLDAYRRTAIECLYPWQNIRILSHVLRPGTKAKDGHWYTAVYYEQILPGKQLYRQIALYDGRAPQLNTCEEKLANRYGGPETVDLQNPPIAMTIYEGSFVLQTTDDPNGGVALEKLPLLFGPLPPKVTRK